MIETHKSQNGVVPTVSRGTSMLPGSFVCLGIIVLLFSGCSGSADPRPNEVAFEPPKAEAKPEGQDLFNRTQDPGDRSVRAVADEVNLAKQADRATANWLLESFSQYH